MNNSTKTQQIVKASLYYFALSGIICAIAAGVAVGLGYGFRTPNAFATVLINAIIFGLAGGALNSGFFALILSRHVLCPSCGLLRSPKITLCPICDFSPSDI